MWLAILLTIGLLIGCGVITALTRVNLFVPMVAGTSVWVGIDSYKLGLIRYQSGISYSPVMLGVLCSLFWVIAFPWFLSMRYKILTGTARLREEFAPSPLKDGEMSARGLIQPWRGRPL